MIANRQLYISFSYHNVIMGKLKATTVRLDESAFKEINVFLSKKPLINDLSELIRLALAEYMKNNSDETKQVDENEQTTRNRNNNC